jgi:hypothetical protein
MSINRRRFIQSAGSVALGTVVNSSTEIAQTVSRGGNFDINQSFAGFMKELGQSPSDGGGAVTFVGQDPILRSHFRIGACMAIPAMAAGVGAAAIWKERTGEGQGVDL